MTSLNPADKISAVFGNDQMPLVITAQDGLHNGWASTWNASGLNPLADFVYYSNHDDSYATIGLSGPASPVPGAEDPSLVQDPSLVPTVSHFFTANTAGEFAELNVNTLTEQPGTCRAQQPTHS